MRRCLGPIGGSVAFILVAGLVFTGLGWVTVTALSVEDAQREAAAEAAVANKLRVALWRVDGRLLPALGAENARNFLEYAPPDPDSAYGPTCAQLLAAPLPDWMKLHAQLDPEDGWTSPQVLTPEARAKFAEAWPELVPANATLERARALDALQRRHSFKTAYAAFAGRDGVPPPDGGRRPADAPPPAKVPTPAAFGLAVTPARPAAEPRKERESVAPAPKEVEVNGIAPAPAPPPRPAPVALEQAARGLERDDNRGDAQARRRAADLAADARQPSTYIYPPNYRQNSTDPQLQNGLNNGLNLGRLPMPVAPGQNPTNPQSQNSFAHKAAPTSGPGDRDGRPMGKFDDKTMVANPGLMAKGAGPGGGGAAQAEGGATKQQAAPSLHGLTDFLARGLSVAPQKDALRAGGDAKAKGATGTVALADRAKEDRGYAAPGSSSPGGFGRGGSGGGFGGSGFGGGFPMPAVPPGMAGPLPSGKSGAEKQDRGEAYTPLAGRVPPASEPKAGSFAAPAGPQVAPIAPGPGAAPVASAPQPAPAFAPATPGLPAGPPPVPLVVAPPAALPMALGVPPLATPDPAPAARVQEAVQPPPADAPAAPVVLFNMPPNAPPVAVHLGPVRPQWLPAADGTDTLVLVRTARLDNRTVYQGVVIDWARLQEVLRDDIKDLFPDATLVAVKAGEAAPDRAMTALPVQLELGPAAAPAAVGWSPLRIGLALAWAAALIAFGAIGLAGWSLIDLSERRIRFVSAVTHELRTPLTSLRLYLDLLLSGMVQDEAKRTEYLSTLATESDRLHRLVDNVLDFARLERRRPGSSLHPAKVADLLATVRDTWTDRCGTDGKELIVVSTLPPEAEVTTDAVLVGQIVGNLIDNARKYTRAASDPRVWVWAKPEGRKVVLEVEDRGPGVAPRERAIIFRPFRRGETADTTAGGAGLGLALCKQWAESLGGTLTYRPADGDTGACFRLELPGK